MSQMFSQEATDADGNVFPISEITFEYADGHKDLPPLDKLNNLTIDLFQGKNGYLPAREDAPVRTIKLGDINSISPSPYLYASTLIHIAQEVVKYYNKENIVGIFVTVDPADIDENGNDLRSSNETAVNFLIYCYLIKEVDCYTIGEDGERVDADNAYDYIMHYSPLKPSALCSGDATDLLCKDTLDEYLYYLNRYPGRRTDVELARSEAGDGFNLDFLVTQSKPWKAYSSVSNTGTRHGQRLVSRYGYIDYQFTNRNDTFSLEYTTTDFDHLHYVNAYYESPLFRSCRTRAFITAGGSKFYSSELGLLEEEFSGSQYFVGGGFIQNVYQCEDFFTDIKASVTWKDIDVNNFLSNVKSSTDILLAQIGVHFDQLKPCSKLFGYLALESNLADLIGTRQSAIDNFGRANPDKQWQVLKGNVNKSFYVDPFNSCCDDGTFPATHELSFSGDFQYAFNYRLIPQVEKIAGGLHTVRGYPQAATSGANVYVCRSEYRLHHCLCGVETLGRFFFDAGRSSFNDKETTEKNYSLYGTGIGAEANYNGCVKLKLRGDLGVALKDVPEKAVNAGHSQFYFVATLLY
jgi:hemolysin activation/secretion protein